MVKKWRETLSLYQSFSQSIARLRDAGEGDCNICKELEYELASLYNRMSKETEERPNDDHDRNVSIEEMCKEARIDYPEFKTDMESFFSDTSDIMIMIERQLNHLKGR